MSTPPHGVTPTPPATDPHVKCPFCNLHPSTIRPPFEGIGTGHFFANCPAPTCQRLGLFDFSNGVVRGSKSCMAFKFEARLLGSDDETLMRVARLVRDGIEAAYLDKWPAAAVTFRVAGEAITVRKILGRKYAPRTKKGELRSHEPLGPLLTQVERSRHDLCMKFRIPPKNMREVIRSLHYLRRVGNTAGHFSVKPKDRIPPNDLSVDLARRKIEIVFENLYAW